MRIEAARSGQLETGGILMGYRDGESIVVTAVIGPGPKGDHQPRNFEPDDEWQADVVATVYQQSARRHTYLGDWHTHPNGQTHTSADDKAVARLIASSPEARAPHPIILIIGTSPSGDIRISAFFYDWLLWNTRIVISDTAVSILMS